METGLGLLGMLVFILCVIALAAAVTWAVVKLTPSKAVDKSQSAPPS